MKEKKTDRDKQCRRDFRRLDMFMTNAFAVIGAIGVYGIIFDDNHGPGPVLAVIISTGMVAVGVYDYLKNK